MAGADRPFVSREVLGMQDDPTVTDLVLAATAGDQQAWDALVERYTPLVMSVAVRYRLSDEDAADVGQTLWLRLVQHLRELREPKALPGWIVATTRNECFRVLRGRQRTQSFDPLDAGIAERAEFRGVEYIDLDADLLRAERHEALLAAFAELPEHHRQLLLLLLADPPLAYAEISRRIGIPIGGIGPTRARALERLRRCPALAALLEADRLADEPAVERAGREPASTRRIKAGGRTDDRFGNRGGGRHGIAPVG
jgi:RNA polymerase sigma factor (sigma-70 family)